MNTQLRHHSSDGCPTCISLPSHFSIKAGMDSEILLRSVPTVFSSPSLLGMIQAFKLADQIMGSHPQRWERQVSRLVEMRLCRVDSSQVGGGIV